MQGNRKQGNLGGHLDGKIVFELSPNFEKGSSMDGMQPKFDGHMWMHPRKSNISVSCNVKLRITSKS